MAETKLLTDNDIAERLGVSRVTVWRYVKKIEDFPKPLKLTGGATRFRSADLEAWIDSRATAA